jgi:hypothetical protein
MREITPNLEPATVDGTTDDASPIYSVINLKENLALYLTPSL